MPNFKSFFHFPVIQKIATPLLVVGYFSCVLLFCIFYAQSSQKSGTIVLLIFWTISYRLNKSPKKGCPPMWRRIRRHLFSNHKAHQFFLRQLGFLLLLNKYMGQNAGLIELAFLTTGFMMIAHFWIPAVFRRVFPLRMLSSLNEDVVNKERSLYDPSLPLFRNRINRVFRNIQKPEILIFIALLFESNSEIKIALWGNLIITASFTVFIAVISLFTFVNRNFRKNEKRILESIKEYDPSFILYFSASNKSFLYQVSQWLPHLKESGHRFVVVTRELNLFRPLANLCEDIPVLRIARLVDLEKIITNSTKGALYVNPGMKNSHLLRLRDITHVQLGHGESDKLASAAKTMRAYDTIAVAGQAAIDRYQKAGIKMHESQFRIIGRPQLSNLSKAEPNTPIRSILYAPTWESPDSSNDYCSVRDFGIPILKFLTTEYPSIRIFVKLHPLTGSIDTSLKNQVNEMQQLIAAANELQLRTEDNSHQFLDTTRKEPIKDFFEESDAMICDISSVLGDFLGTLKPTFVCDVQNAGKVSLDEEYPTTRGSYIISSASNIESVMNAAISKDTKLEDRLRTTEYIFGENMEDPEKGFFTLLDEIAT